jgi:flagellar basal-body rod modification protein FlgD
MSITSTLPASTNPSSSSTISGAANAPTSTSEKSSAAFQKLGPDAFLQLLTTQLKNQNPLNPIDDTQSIAELAQFSQLQASTNLENSFSSFQKNFGVVQSASLIGRHVTVSDSLNSDGSSKSGGSTITGVVTGVTITNGAPSFTLKDSKGSPTIDPTTGAAATYDVSQILSIQPT